jgi:hypothetical protein
MHAIFVFSALCGGIGFASGIYFAGNVRAELKSLHGKADAILAAVQAVVKALRANV